MSARDCLRRFCVARERGEAPTFRAASSRVCVACYTASQQARTEATREAKRRRHRRNQRLAALRDRIPRPRREAA